MTANTVLTSGAPQAWDAYKGGQRNALIYGAVYEGLAADEDDAAAKFAAGDIAIGACHEHGCVGSVVPPINSVPAQKSGPFRVVPDSVCDPHTILLHGVLSIFRNRAMRQLEIIAPRHQLDVLGAPAKPVAGTLKIPGFLRGRSL